MSSIRADQKSCTGFTLLELVITLAIVAIAAGLASVGIAGIKKSPMQHRQALASALLSARDHSIYTGQKTMVLQEQHNWEIIELSDTCEPSKLAFDHHCNRALPVNAATEPQQARLLSTLNDSRPISPNISNSRPSRLYRLVIPEHLFICIEATGLPDCETNKFEDNLQLQTQAVIFTRGMPNQALRIHVSDSTNASLSLTLDLLGQLSFDSPQGSQGHTELMHGAKE